MLEYIQNMQLLIDAHPLLFILLILWTMLWKGLSMWKAARLSHTRWFLALLILNTAGILDILYLYFVARKYTVVSETETEKDDAEPKSE